MVKRKLILLLCYASVLFAKQDIPHDRNVVIAMADSLHGWSIGAFKNAGPLKDSLNTRTYYHWMIMKTIDAGRKWLLQAVLEKSEAALKAVCLFALDENHAWTIVQIPGKDQYFILSTEDGNRWTKSSFALPEVEPLQIAFTDSRNGWLIGRELLQTRLYKTQDAGKTWQTADVGHRITPEGIQFNKKGIGYIAAHPLEHPNNLVILKTVDRGNIWIIANELSPEKDFRMELSSMAVGEVHVALLVRSIRENYPDYDRYRMIRSSDGFISITNTEFSSDKEKDSHVFDNIWLAGEKYMTFSASDEGNWLWTSSEASKKWNAEEISFDLSGGHISSAGVILGNRDGGIFISPDFGRTKDDAELDFRGTFLSPRGQENIAEYAFGFDSDEFDKDSIYSSRWESAEDSMFAVNYSKENSSKKYRPDLTLDFSVGIDSAWTTQIAFHRRTGFGAKRGTLNLLKEELRVGEIRLRKYKTFSLKGVVRATNGRQASKYSWTSSISGELSDQLTLITSPKQLPAGIHYILFRAMDNQGKWSNPMVIKIIIEEFPKYRFPFSGSWVTGGGGSYYNTGHHIRSVKYGLDLNNVEAGPGGDTDYGFPVRAATDGIVTLASTIKGYGRTVKIDYSYGGKKYTTLTSHLSTISVEVGERVRQGQEVGVCGSTGRSSAPHIHWELRVDGINESPEPIFENDSTVIQEIKNGQSFNSDNIYEPEHIVVVPEGDIENTVWDYHGYHHSYRYAMAVKNRKTAEVLWRPKLPRTGSYKVQVHIPKKFADAEAVYKVNSKSGIQDIKVVQKKFSDEWVTLGIFLFEKDDDVFLSLSNMTASGRGTIAFDDVRFIGQWVNETN